MNSSSLLPEGKRTNSITLAAEWVAVVEVAAECSLPFCLHHHPIDVPRLDLS